MRLSAIVVLLSIVSSALADFQLQVIAANGPFAGTYVSDYHVGTNTFLAVAGAIGNGVTFSIGNNGSLTQTDMYGLPAGSINGYFLGNNGTAPLYLGVGGGNVTFSVSQIGTYPTAQLSFNGNSQWYVCTTKSIFGPSVPGGINIALDGAPVPSGCQGVILAALTTLPASTSSMMSSTTIAPSATGAVTINGLFNILVTGTGLTQTYLTGNHVGAALDIGVASGAMSSFTLINGKVSLTGLSFPGTLGFMNQTAVESLFIGAFQGINANFSVSSNGQLLVNDKNKWLLCNGVNTLGYTYDKVVRFQFASNGTNSTNCQSVDLIVIPATTITTTVTTMPPTITSVIPCLTCTHRVVTEVVVTITPCPTCAVTTTIVPKTIVVSGTQPTMVQYNPASSADKAAIGFGTLISALCAVFAVAL